MGARRRRWLIFLAIVGGAVIGLVLAAPEILRWATVRAIERTGNYEGRIGAVEIDWRRAALVYRDVTVDDLEHHRRVLEVPRADVDLVGSSLVHRPLRLSVVAERPKVVLITDRSAEDPVARSTSATLQRSPYFVVDRLLVRDGTLVTTSAALEQNLTFDHVRLEARDVSNHPARKGERRAHVSMEAHLAKGGHVSATLSADLLDAPSDLRLHVRSEDVPLQVAAPVTERKADVVPTDGTGELLLEAKMVNGRFEGSAQVKIEDPSFGKEPGTGVGGKLKSEIADKGAKLIAGGGPIERSVDFAGRARAKRPVLTEAISDIVDRAAKTLGKGAA